MGSISTETPRAWWKESSVYQIYTPSFKDSNGDGIGDLRGVIDKLDYIQNLGVDIVWLNPVFKSPQVDMGYDISDYVDIHPPYGTAADVDELTEALHQRGMRLVMDLVVNHTSDQHPWFQESRSSPTNEYRDWYIWKKPKFGKDGQRQPPNNWVSYFGGSAWEYDAASGEYYLHLFAKEQPDLNWETPAVRAAVEKIMRYWLDKGIDGFRMDVINFISKDLDFPDAAITNPDSVWQNGAQYYACGPRLHEYLQDIGKILKEYDAFSVGEMPEVNDSDEILKAVGFDRGELSMIFHFELMGLDHGAGGKFTPREWKVSELKSIVSKWQTVMHENNGWNALYLENHDQPRTVSRFAVDHPQYRALSAKLLATFLGFQSGTVFIYQGQELGMANVPHDWTIDRYRDIETLNHWEELQLTKQDQSALHAATLAEYRSKSRDNARTPIQWDDSTNAGFSTGVPWIPVHEDYPAWNAAAQLAEQGSVYHYWARVLQLRKQYPDIFVYGSFELVSSDDSEIFAYARHSSAGTALVVLNFEPKEVSWTMPQNLFAGRGAEVVLSNYSRGKISTVAGERITLAPLEAFVLLSATPFVRL
ncbi:CAZyme family GH13 [Penicillium subrubescens]|uniref:Alpha-glucosidase n=1 Tax=Penicillium subrubescens TaxID=1316194 RepID=A0A1Q5T8V9_9EURO|nr:CAZyme family GH13 [Penicillium subrubescens]KAJ5912191.1 CAZyme family GH13 [Penicillium subrubescens]OKO96663.1 Alpha-glucosidase [Penicillium subrubescens]